MQKQTSSLTPLKFGTVLIAMFIFGIVFRRFAFLLFIIATLLVFIGSIYFIIKNIREGKKQLAFQNSMDGSIAQNLRLCGEQIKKNEIELLEIQDNINELRDKIDDKMSVNETTLIETDMLVSGFERELDLRKAKLDFYRICQEKLKNIDFNQKLSAEIVSKKEKLKKLQEDHFDDLAEMEQLRSNMEYNKSYINTINNLSIRMAESTSLSTAQELHNELKAITEELKDL